MISIILTVALFGLLAWAICYFFPMPPKIKTAIYVAASIVAFLYLLEAVGFRLPFHLPRLLG